MLSASNASVRTLLELEENAGESYFFSCSSFFDSLDESAS